MFIIFYINLVKPLVWNYIFLDGVSNNNVVSGVFLFQILHHRSWSRRKEPQIIDPLPYTRNSTGLSFVYPKTDFSPQLSGVVSPTSSFSKLLPQLSCTKHGIRILHLVLLYIFFVSS